MQDIALGISKYSTIEESPKDPKDVCANIFRTIAFYFGIGGKIVFMVIVLVTALQNNVLDRYVRSYEVKYMSSIPFPNIYVCNNYDPSPRSSDYPIDRGCTVSVVEQFPGMKSPCMAPYVKKDIRVFNISCLLYGNQTALSKAYTLRINVDFGNGTSATTPWAGGFLLLRDPIYGDDIDEETFSSSRWHILSSNVYYLFHLELELETNDMNFDLEEEDKNAKGDTTKLSPPIQLLLRLGGNC